MPYVLVGKCVHKKNPDGSAGETVPGGCHDTEEKAKAHMRALYANVQDSALAEFSLTIVKAAYDKSEADPNKKRRISLVSSNTDSDLYAEKMSLDLFKDFADHIANNHPIPEAFRSAICEDGVWCGGMPYLSIAHYKAGRDAKNVPGTIESVYVDGNQLKSKAYLHDTPLGRKMFDALCEDLEKFKSGTKDHKPVRVSIGFLDLEHIHEVQGKSVTFTRTELGQKCALCEQGVGGKIYKKGYLVHEAATRVPVNPGTEMSLEEKSMGEAIITKHDDAASIIGDELAQELEQKSVADDVLVVKADGTETTNTPTTELVPCYDPNTDSYDQNCINQTMMKWMTEMRNDMNTVKSNVDEVTKSLEKSQVSPVVEEIIMDSKMEKDHEEMESEEKKEEEATKSVPSALDVQFNTLKSVLAGGKSLKEVQDAFTALGKEVEKSYVVPPASPEDIAAIVRSSVEAAVAPLVVKIAQLEAGNKTPVTKSMEHPVSRALTLKPEELTRKAQPVVSEQMSQIQKIARASVYGQ